MSKVSFYFSCAFIIAFGFSFTLVSKPSSHRVPASYDEYLPVTADQTQLTAAQQTNADAAYARINDLYTQAVARDTALAQASSVYSAALQQSIANRQAQIASNPNSFMWPGAMSYDSQYNHLSQAGYAITSDRTFNILSTFQQIQLIYQGNHDKMSEEQKADVAAKRNQLVLMMGSLSSNTLYTWPTANDPFLLNAMTGTPLGTQQTAPLNPSLVAQGVTLTGATGLPMSNNDVPVGGNTVTPSVMDGPLMAAPVTSDTVTPVVQ